MTLGLYLSKLIGARVLLCWVVLLVIGLGIDLLRSSSDLIEQGGAGMVARYAWFRLPLLGTILLPISVLTGAIIGFMTLNSRSELTVVRAAGRSTLRLMSGLVPMILVLGMAHHLLGNNLSSWAQRGLIAMFPLEIAAPTAPEPGDSVWNRSQSDVLNAVPAAEDGSELTDISIFRLDTEGRMIARLRATEGRFVDGAWQLQDVQRRAEGQTEKLDSFVWESQILPSDVVELARNQGIVTMARAQAVLAGDAVATRGLALYQTQLWRGYVAFVVPAIMLLLAAISAFGSARHGSGAKQAGLAVVLGFLYVACDGFVASLGNVGAVPPLIAALAPSGVFLIIALWCLLMQES